MRRVRISGVALIAALLTPSGVSAHSDGKHTGDHPHCPGGDDSANPG